MGVRERTQSKRKPTQRKMKIPIVLLVACVASLQAASLMEVTECPVECCPTTTIAPTTEAPTEGPTEDPTEDPTEAPTEGPTEGPTEDPTEAPTEEREAATDDASTPDPKPHICSIC